MNLIVCLDDRNGMSFAGKRQSMDCVLREKVLQLTECSVLWMNAYSANQFSQTVGNIRVAEDFLQKAGNGEYCFAENADIALYADKVETLILYRWNRRYPFDTALPSVFTGEQWKKVDYLNFAGHSHDTITQEVYVRC